MKNILIRPLWVNLFIKASCEKAKDNVNYNYIYHVKERFLMKLLKGLK